MPRFFLLAAVLDLSACSTPQLTPVPSGLAQVQEATPSAPETETKPAPPKKLHPWAEAARSAVSSHDVHLMRILLQEGFPVDAPLDLEKDGADGWNALQSCCAGPPDEEMLRLLLRNGASKFMRDREGKRPIDLAMGSQNWTACAMLAEPEVKEKIIEGVPVGLWQEVILQLADVRRDTTYGVLVKGKPASPELLKLMRGLGVKVIPVSEIRTDLEANSYRHSTITGDLEKLNFSFQKKDGFFHCESIRYLDPRHPAYLRTADVIKSYGYWIPSQIRFDDLSLPPEVAPGHVPLHPLSRASQSAAMKGDIPLMRLLLGNGFPVNERTDVWNENNGPTALFWAVAEENVEMVKFLLSQGADPEGSYPRVIEEAVEKKNQTICQLLARPDTEDKLMEGIPLEVLERSTKRISDRREGLRFIKFNGKDPTPEMMRYLSHFGPRLVPASQIGSAERDQYLHRETNEVGDLVEITYDENDRNIPFGSSRQDGKPLAPLAKGKAYSWSIRTTSGTFLSGGGLRGRLEKRYGYWVMIECGGWSE